MVGMTVLTPALNLQKQQTILDIPITETVITCIMHQIV
jgi:hypothetical protein